MRTGRLTRAPQRSSIGSKDRRAITRVAGLLLDVGGLDVPCDVVNLVVDFDFHPCRPPTNGGAGQLCDNTRSSARQMIDSQSPPKGLHPTLGGTERGAQLLLQCGDDA